MHLVCLLPLIGLLAAACSSSGHVYTEKDSATPTPSCAVACPGPVRDGGAESRFRAEIGVPGGPDGLDYAALAPGGVLRLQTLGQGGTHVFLAIRTVGFGSRASVTLTLRNLTTGKEISSPAPPRPQLLFCDDAKTVCDLVPLTVMTGGLTAADEERDGLRITIEAEVHNDVGAQAFASHEATLSTADL